MLAVNAVLFLFLIAHAQSPGGWVAGRVRDAKDSRPLEGVRVSVSRPDGREYVGTSTDSSGSYRILAVPPGGYQISFAAVGYRTLTVAGVAVQSERASFVDLAMEESGADGNGHAEVRWKGRPVNEWGTAYGTVFDRPRLDNLPSPRNIWALLENQEPSSVANRVDEGGMATGTIGLVGVHGGSSWTQNDYRLDGIDVTDPHDTGKPLLYPTFGGLQEFQVSTADHPSERPVPGASSNLTTREGTSEFHFQGEAYYLGRPFQSSNLTKGLRDFGFTTTPHFKEFGEGEFDLGGPIPAGRDWSFFASFGLQHLSTVLPGFSDVPTRSVSSGLLRVDGVLGPQDRLSFMATGQVVRNSNLGAGGGVAPSATLRGNDRFEVGQVHWIHRIDSESVWELGFGYSHASPSETFQAGVPGPDRMQLFTGETSGAAPFASAASRSRISLAGTGQTSLHVPANLRHLLSFGFEVEDSRDTESLSVFDGTQLLFFPENVPSEVVEYNTPSLAKQRLREASFFVQDHLRIWDRIFIHFGLTLDSSIASLPSQGAPPGAFAAARQFGGTGSVVSWTTISPRFGVAIPLSRSGVTRVLASFARYYNILPAQYAEFANPDSLGGRVFTWADRNGDGQFQAGEEGTLLRVFGGPFSSVDPKLRRPYTNEWTIGLDQSFFHRFDASLRLIRRDAKQPINRVNVGIPASAYTPVKIVDPGDDFKQGTGDDQNLIVYNQDPRTLGQDRFLLTNPPGLNANYEGLEAVIRAGLFRDWGMSLSFSAFMAKGTTNPGNSEFQNDPGVIGSLFDDPNNLLNARGRVYFDRAYVGKIVAYGKAPFGFHLGSVISYYDGLPFGRELIVTGLNQGPIFIMAKPRFYRTQFNLTFDQRISRDFLIGSHKITFLADAFNLLNVNKNLMEEALSGPLFPLRVPLAVENPRVIRFGIKFGF